MSFLQHLVIFLSTTTLVVVAAIAADALLENEDRAEAKTRRAIRAAHE